MDLDSDRITTGGDPGGDGKGGMAVRLAEDTTFDFGHNRVEAAPPEAADPFDPARLRLTQDFASTVGVKRLSLTIPVRKPSREWWITVHPDEGFRVQTGLLELKEDREIYLIDPDLWPELAAEATFGPRALFTAQNRQGVVFLWPIRLPGPDGRIDDWNKCALEAAMIATKKWIRLSANMSLGAYDVFETVTKLPAPTWPDLEFKDILRTAFKDKHITSLDHHVLRQLRGEA